MGAAERAVREAILGGSLAPGQRLPPERQLAETLGLSRLTLRAGLSRLAAAGLLSVRQGSGYVVRDYRRRGGLDLLPGLADLAERDGRLTEIAEDLLRVRLQLSRAVLERLVERAQRGAQARVAAAVEAFAQVVATRGGVEAIAQADIDVLAAILDETGSAVLRLCLNPVSAVVAGMPRLRAAIYAAPEENLLGWRALVAWLGAPRLETIDLMVAQLARHDAETLRRLAAVEAKPTRRRRR